jgi:hypothetical protein
MAELWIILWTLINNKYLILIEKFVIWKLHKNQKIIVRIIDNYNTYL